MENKNMKEKRRIAFIKINFEDFEASRIDFFMALLWRFWRASKKEKYRLCLKKS